VNDHILKWGPFIDQAVRRWAKKCPRESRNDLKQDIYLQLLRDKTIEPRMQKLRGATLNKYMAATARNKVCEIYRLAAKEPIEWVSLEEVDRHKMVEMDTRFMEMLSVLTPEERAIVTLFYRDRASQAEIGQRYDKPRHWVRATLDKAIKKLRKQEG
jgi:RNA polymerase sigma factor (sigma-70 family)